MNTISVAEDLVVWEVDEWRQEACVEVEARWGYVCSWISTSGDGAECGEVVGVEDGERVEAVVGLAGTNGARKCFMVEMERRLTQAQAEQRCASGYSFKGGRLASIETHSEREALRSLLTSQPSTVSRVETFWIGHNLLAASEEDGCAECEEGTWCIGGSKTSCPDHSWSQRGSSAEEQCECLLGYYGPGRGPCASCPAGSWCPGGEEAR
eukprot:921143-Rhodomonas_salina.1